MLKIVFFVICLWIDVVCPAPRGIIVVPGLGRADRLQTVVSNLKLLEHKYIKGKHHQWDCVVYVYADRIEESFWSHTDELDYVRSLCDIVENVNKRVTENLFMLQPALLRASYSRIFILLDDCKLKGKDGSFDLSGMLRVMKYNNLTVISPLISGANKGGGQKFRNIMQTDAMAGTAGYVSSFVEIFVWVLTMPAYQALWELLCPAVNPYGWGYDFWYDGYARTRVPGHKMGILSTERVTHEQGDERSDNAGMEDKWKAVLAQEKHYKRHLGVDLAHYRNSLDLANTSWNGAVKGLLYHRPPSRTMLDNPSREHSIEVKRLRTKRSKEGDVVTV